MSPSEATESPEVGSAESTKSKGKFKLIAILCACLMAFGFVTMMVNARAANEASKEYVLKSTNCFDSQTYAFKSEENYDWSANNYSGDSIEGTTITGQTYYECRSELDALDSERYSKKNASNNGRNLLILATLGLVAALLFSITFTIRAKKSQNEIQSNRNVVDEIARLNDMHQSGAISDSEFEALKAKVIDNK